MVSNPADATTARCCSFVGGACNETHGETGNHRKSSQRTSIFFKFFSMITIMLLIIESNFLPDMDLLTTSYCQWFFS